MSEEKDTRELISEALAYYDRGINTWGRDRLGQALTQLDAEQKEKEQRRAYGQFQGWLVYKVALVPLGQIWISKQETGFECFAIVKEKQALAGKSKKFSTELVQKRGKDATDRTK